MNPSARDLDRQATRLVRRAIVHHTMEKDYRTGNWPREELLNDGYSQAVVRRARHIDDAALARQGWFVPLYLFNIGVARNSVTRDRYATLEISLLAVMIMGLFALALYRLYLSFRTRPAPDDDRLVVEELSPRLGPETLTEAFYADEYSTVSAWRNPQPRKALLWRLDAFLSRKKVTE
jgi:hypothetical protein